VREAHDLGVHVDHQPARGEAWGQG
jgi:hypothetical protein